MRSEEDVVKTVQAAVLGKRLRLEGVQRGAPNPALLERPGEGVPGLGGIGPPGIVVDRHQLDAADTRIVAVFADPRGWKGHAGLSETGRRRARDLVAGAGSRPTGVVLFGDPAWSSDLPSGVPVLNAWGGEPLMQAAAGARIAGLRDG